MEEDIIDKLELLIMETKESAFPTYWSKENAELVENLIARYKELEEKVNKYEKQIDLEWVEENYIPNERLIHYMDVALENSKQCLKKGNKIRANEEYKRYKDLKDIVDDLVYHKTLAKGDE